TIFRAARTLDRIFAGQIVSRFESVFPALTRVAEDRPIIGRTIASVFARGKHLLFEFSDDLFLRTHMRMSGSWHVYPAGAPWQRPARDMRIIVGTNDAVAVAFRVPVAELVDGRGLARHRDLRALGPDLLGGRFDADDALRRVRARGNEAVADALLNQRVVAGIGNVFKSEILFLAGVQPFTPAGSLSEDEIAHILHVARDALAANVLDRSQTLSAGIGRRTTRSLDPGARLWVYGRAGKRCRRCGSVVRVKKTGIDARLTYWCPACQPERTRAR